MIPILQLTDPAQRQRVEQLLAALRLSSADAILQSGRRAEQSKAVRQIMPDVAKRGDAALVDSGRQFDDPSFTADRLRVTQAEMAAAAARLPAEQIAALRRSISQVREYQTHIMPT